jgi:hypothetical protein
MAWEALGNWKDSCTLKWLALALGFNQKKIVDLLLHIIGTS